MSYAHKQQEERFFINLCEEYQEKVLKYLYYSVGSIEDAKDLTQEVFTLTYDRIGEIMNHENPAAFIYQTAKFKAANFRRKQNTKGYYECNLIEETLVENEQNVYDKMMKEKDERIDETCYIEDILQTMGEQQRCLYNYRYVEKKSYKEISLLMGTDEVTLRMRCLRIRGQLKKKIKEVGVKYFE